MTGVGSSPALAVTGVGSSPALATCETNQVLLVGVSGVFCGKHYFVIFALKHRLWVLFMWRF